MSAIDPRTAPLPGAERGFTLIEMLVVLAIAGLIGGIAFPAIQRMIARQDFEGTAAQVALIVRTARADAIRRGIPVHLGLSADGRQFGGPGKAGLRVPETMALSLPPHGIDFFDDGTSTGGAVLLGGHGMVRRLVVDRDAGTIAAVS